ncbi:MAG: hypothetical protein M0Z38_12740 [Deltaproteobacteria bacterium]|nr:hypothetical protein [Deltaproteobacteria bacterium]
MKRPGFLILVLSLSSLFFGWRSYEAWTRPVAFLAPRSSGPAASPAGVSMTAVAAPSMDLSAPVASIVASPVFRPDRKPYSEASAALSKRNYEAEMARFMLVGVFQMEKEKKGVVVGKSGSAKEERWEVGPGDALPGFLVKDVGLDGMTLVTEDREFLLPLYAGGPKTSPGQAPARTDLGSQRPAAPQPPPLPAAQAGGAPAGSQPARAATPSMVVAPQPPPQPVYYPRRNIRPPYNPGRR